MSEEFKKTDSNAVNSTKDFSVKVKPVGGILYCDAAGEVSIDTEWLVNPHGIILYTKGFETCEQSRFHTIFSNATRALEYLGHPVEIWSLDGPQNMKLFRS